MDYGYEDVLDFEGFDYVDVKSAVEGLKKDISKFRAKNPCFNPPTADLTSK